MPDNQGPDFLVVGLEKSGTHWVTALLNAHPQLACFPAKPYQMEKGGYNPDVIGEVHLFNTLASLEPDREGRHTRELENYLTKHQGVFTDLVQFKDKVPKQELYRLFIERYNQLCQQQKGNKELVGESTPAYVFHLDFIDSFYPGIKKICIIRDPKDKIVSWHYNQLRKKRKTEAAISDQFILDYCHDRIIKELKALLDYRGIIHCLTYEALSSQTRLVVEAMLKYLGVGINDQIIKRMIAAADFKKLNAADSGTAGRARGEQSLNSQYRKGIVGDWQSHLTERQARLVDDLTGALRQKVFAKYKVNLII